MTRRVAIIAGINFPPVSNASVHRVIACLHHLPESDWKGEVFTLPADYRREDERDESLLASVPQESVVHRISPIWPRRVPRGLVGTGNAEVETLSVTQSLGWRVASVLKEWILLPDSRVTWVPPAIASLVRAHRKDPYDVIFSTSQENSSHLVGLIASGALHLPWAADFQDPWRSPWLPARHPVQERLDNAMARIVIKRSSVIIATSPSVKRSLEAGYGAPSRKIHLVPNGFEPSGYTAKFGTADSERFTIVHTGRFYGKRVPTPALQAVDSVLKKRPDLEQRLLIRLIGTFDEASAAAVRPFSSRPWLELVKPLPHADAMREQADADLLLLIPGEQSMSMPGKIFEYLRARRPILCLASQDSDAAALLSDLDTGSVIDPEDQDGIGRFILEALLRGRQEEQASDERLDAYYWDNVVGQMVAVLESLFADSKGKRNGRL